MGGNEAQKDYWNAAVGQTWATLQGQLDRQLAPLGAAGLAALAPRPGETLLDIGCGAGATTLALAQAAGATGHVLGLDISEPMLAVARRRIAEAGAAAEVQTADVQTADIGESRFDGAFSRFGVMFFADPVAAFANVRRSLKPQGRLAFVCWRTLAENGWQRVPLEAAKPILPPLAPSDPLAPGPFAFADAARVRNILGEAGFTDVAVSPFDTEIGAGDLDQTLALSLEVGPLSRALREHPGYREAAVGVVRQALAAYVTQAGLKLPAAIWVVTATRG
ncbi:class I SAM-dependent methyltransferase [Acidisoma sp. 7E03]